MLISLGICAIINRLTSLTWIEIPFLSYCSYVTWEKSLLKLSFWPLSSLLNGDSNTDLRVRVEEAELLYLHDHPKVLMYRKGSVG